MPHLLDRIPVKEDKSNQIARSKQGKRPNKFDRGRGIKVIERRRIFYAVVVSFINPDIVSKFYYGTGDEVE